MAHKLSFKNYWDLFIAPLAQQKRRLLQLGAALIFLFLVQGFFLVLLGPFAQALFSSAGLAEEISLGSLLPEKMRAFVPFLSQMLVKKSWLIYLVPSGLLVVALLRNGANYLYAISSAGLSLYLSKVYRDRFFLHIISQPYLAIQEKTPAQWMSHVMNDVLYLETRFSDILNSFVRDVVVMISALISLSIIHPPTALVIALVAPCIALVMGRTGKKIARYAEAFQQELSNLAAHILDLRRHFNFMRSQQGEQRERGRFAEVNRSYYRRVLRSILVRSAFAPVLEWIGFAAFALFTLYVSRSSSAGTSSLGVGNLLMFFAALGILMRPLRNFGEQLAKFHETKGALAKSLEFISSGEARRGAEGMASVKNSLHIEMPQTLSISEIKGGYPQGSVQLDIDKITLQRGRSIALVGPSGSGKSTLIKMCAGLIAPSSWKGDLSWSELAACASMVSQAPFLFSGTLGQNLRYGFSAARLENFSDAAITAVLRIVAMEQTVAALPAGLEYPLESITGNLSGGQIQRLVIARGLLQGKPLLLLDEATSAIDEATEREVTAAVLELGKREGLCVVAITHRLQLLGHYDEVWYMEQGRIVAQGSVQELMRVPKFYEFSCESRSSK